MAATTVTRAVRRLRARALRHGTQGHRWWRATGPPIVHRRPRTTVTAVRQGRSFAHGSRLRSFDSTGLVFK
eukprot:2660043-Prymnesium_polylepis.1